jgi:hypothetical protein
MLNRYFASIAGAAGAILFLAGQAGAASIPVPSFEDPTLSPGGYTMGACPSGWDCSGSPGYYGGVYYPTTSQFAPGADGVSGSTPGGNNAAYVFGLVPQQLALYGVSTIAANTTYLLSVWAGARADQGPDAWALGFTALIQFLANGTVVASQSIPDPGLGMWKSVTLSLDSNTIPSDVGDFLGIRLVWTSTGASTYTQVAWDDVTLNSFADGSAPPSTPIPGAVWLFGSAIAGSAGIARWRRKRNSVQSETSSL